MSLVRWEPFPEFDDLFRQLSPLMGRRVRAGNGQSAGWAPVANISESDKEFLIKLDLPAVKKEDVNVTLEHGVISISGERKQEKEHKDENELRIESHYGSFTRSFSLPENVDAASVRAESKDGVLTVRVPKKLPEKPKAISIPVQ